MDGLWFQVVDSEFGELRRGDSPVIEVGEYGVGGRSAMDEHALLFLRTCSGFRICVEGGEDVVVVTGGDGGQGGS
jgi:hypothetical protein